MNCSDHLSSLFSLLIQCCERLASFLSIVCFAWSACCSSAFFLSFLFLLFLLHICLCAPQQYHKSFSLSSLPRRVHLLRTHATRSAPKPDWQVHERGKGCRAGEVKSDRVKWDTLALQTSAAASDPLLSPTEVSGLKANERGMVEGRWDSWKSVGEGVLVCGVACCVQVWS